MIINRVEIVIQSPSLRYGEEYTSLIWCVPFGTFKPTNVLFTSKVSAFFPSISACQPMLYGIEVTRTPRCVEDICPLML